MKSKTVGLNVLVYRTLAGKHEVNGPRSRWEDYIEMNLREAFSSDSKIRFLWQPTPNFCLIKTNEPAHNGPSLMPLETVESSPHFTFTTLVSLKYILQLPSRLSLGLPGYLFPSGFPTKNLYEFVVSPMRAVCLSHITFLFLLS